MFELRSLVRKRAVPSQVHGALLIIVLDLHREELKPPLILLRDLFQLASLPSSWAFALGFFTRIVHNILSLLFPSCPQPFLDYRDDVFNSTAGVPHQLRTICDAVSVALPPPNKWACVKSSQFRHDCAPPAEPSFSSHWWWHTHGTTFSDTWALHLRRRQSLQRHNVACWPRLWSKCTERWPTLLHLSSPHISRNCGDMFTRAHVPLHLASALPFFERLVLLGGHQLTLELQHQNAIALQPLRGRSLVAVETQFIFDKRPGDCASILSLSTSESHADMDSFVVLLLLHTT